MPPNPNPCHPEQAFFTWRRTSTFFVNCHPRKALPKNFACNLQSCFEVVGTGKSQAENALQCLRTDLLDPANQQSPVFIGACQAIDSRTFKYYPIDPEFIS